jgi:hypothetical protein
MKKFLINITSFYFLFLLLTFLFDYFFVSLTCGCCAVDGTAIGQLVLSSLLPLKARRLSKLEREQFDVPADLREILVGLFLGDLHAEKRSINTRLKFGQGVIHKDYLYHLYEMFKQFSSATPNIINRLPHRITGKIYSEICFNTYSLPCFNEFHNLFYPNKSKVVPLNIGELLTPLSLAYWLADDGSFEQINRGVKIATNCFTLDEVKLLISVLSGKFNLNCTIQHDNGFVLRISAKSLPHLQVLLKDKMPPMMLHKIGL